MKKMNALNNVAAAALVLGLAATPGSSGADDRLSGADLFEALRAGGYVIYIRHTRTETDYADQISAEMGNCATQRVLSEAGWLDAHAIGAAFTMHGIPVAQVYSSEYCRAWQTASLAFGRYVKTPDLNFEPGEEYTEEQFAAMRDRVQPLISETPPEGFNTVLVGHDDPFEAATGIYPEPMGVAFVIKPDDQGGFEVVGDVAPDEWLR